MDLDDFPAIEGFEDMATIEEITVQTEQALDDNPELFHKKKKTKRKTSTGGRGSRGRGTRRGTGGPTRGMTRGCRTRGGTGSGRKSGSSISSAYSPDYHSNTSPCSSDSDLEFLRMRGRPRASRARGGTSRGRGSKRNTSENRTPRGTHRRGVRTRGPSRGSNTGRHVFSETERACVARDINATCDTGFDESHLTGNRRCQKRKPREKTPKSRDAGCSTSTQTITGTLPPPPIYEPISPYSELETDPTVAGDAMAMATAMPSTNHRPQTYLLSGQPYNGSLPNEAEEKSIKPNTEGPGDYVAGGTKDSSVHGYLQEYLDSISSSGEGAGASPATQGNGRDCNSPRGDGDLLFSPLGDAPQDILDAMCGDLQSDSNQVLTQRTIDDSDQKRLGAHQQETSNQEDKNNNHAVSKYSAGCDRSPATTALTGASPLTVAPSRGICYTTTATTTADITHTAGLNSDRSIDTRRSGGSGEPSSEVQCSADVIDDVKAEASGYPSDSCSSSQDSGDTMAHYNPAYNYYQNGNWPGQYPQNQPTRLPRPAAASHQSGSSAGYPPPVPGMAWPPSRVVRPGMTSRAWPGGPNPHQHNYPQQQGVQGYPVSSRNPITKEYQNTGFPGMPPDVAQQRVAAQNCHPMHPGLAPQQVLPCHGYPGSGIVPRKQNPGNLQVR